jgi:periplasmic divalent cation tolerance protein
MTDKRVVLVTCGSSKEARRIARALVQDHLAACVNILATPVRSVYRWQGRIEEVREILLVVKTSRRLLAALERRVRVLHSYDVPEILALPIAEGSSAYLKWLADSLLASKSAARNRLRGG